MSEKKKKFLGKMSRVMIIALLLAGSALLLSYSNSAQAGSYFKSAKDTISDSDRSVTATHTFVASTTTTIPAGGWIEMVFPADFTTVSSSSMVCPSGSLKGGSGNTLKCSFASQRTATSTTIVVPGVTNPSATGSYRIWMYTRDSGGTEIEKAAPMVAILDDVSVTASVLSSLIFTVNGLASGAVVNGVATNASSSFQALTYGTLNPNTPKIMGQRLNVSTNAANGFTVTVAQDHNLLSNSGADIDSFKDGVPGAAQAWAAPSNSLAGGEATYGHFGLTSQDANLSGGDDFGNSLFKGFSGTTPMEVLYHTGPADGSTANIGSTSVAYEIEIGALQEAGDYSSSLTYICTPTY